MTRTKGAIAVDFTTVSPTKIRAVLPNDARAKDRIPPGHYMLFILENKAAHGGAQHDVPSQARIVLVD